MTDVQQTGRKKFIGGGLGKISLVFACGTSLFADGYINSAAGTVNTILGRIYPDDYGKNHYSQLFSGMAYLGTVVGMLSFGYLVDRYGRKYGMLTASGIMIVFTALSAGAYGAGGSVQGLFAALTAYRALTGIGIGRFQHGMFIAATNAMIDLGFVVASFVPLVLLWICGENHLRAVWRLTFGVGIVPMLAVFLWRLRMPAEPDRYRQSCIKKNVPYKLIIKRYWRSFLGVSLCWFLYDFITCKSPHSIFTLLIVDVITGGSTKLSTVFVWNLIINAFYMPGAIAGGLLVDWIGPKKQLISFLCLQGVLGFFLAGFYTHLLDKIAAFAVLYGLFLAFGEAGPGDCLGLLASKSWPTAARGQMYGLAAAIGKIGAYVGVWAFPAMIDDFGTGAIATRGPFFVGSGLAFLSALVALLLIPEVRLDGMTQTDAEFREYLAVNGYDVSQMGMGESTEELERTPSSRDEEKAPSV
ncbi:hypothetical protein JCM10207_004146 [Rhodosporidiobolus poonsookiae]